MGLESLYKEPTNSVPASTAEESESNQQARRFYEGALVEPLAQQPDSKVEIILPPLEGEKISRRIDFVWLSELPNRITSDLRTAHQRGHLTNNLSHWIGVLDGGELADKAYVKKLKEYQKEVTGIYGKDSALLEKVIETLTELRPSKVG